MLGEQGSRTVLETMRKAAHMLSGVLQEPEIIEVLLEQVASIFSTSRTLVLLLGPDGNELIPVRSTGLSGHYLASMPLQVSRSWVGRRVMKGEYVILQIGTGADLESAAAADEDLKVLVAVPLAVRDHVIGILHLYVDRDVPESSEELMLLCTLADLGALALERARHHQSLYRISEALNSTLEIQPMLQRVLEATVREMWLKAASIRLLDPQKQVLTLIASYGLSTAYRNKGEVHLAKSDIDRRVLRGEHVVLCDIEHSSILEYPQEVLDEGILSILAVPLQFRGRALGVMRVYSAQPRHFCSVGVTFLKSVADLVSIALQNAELYAALQARYKNLKTDLADWHRFLALG